MDVLMISKIKTKEITITSACQSLADILNKNPARIAAIAMYTWIRIFGWVLSPGLRTQPNMRIHVYIAIAAILAGFLFKISASDWQALVIVISFVFILEIINTSIETLVDLYTEE